MLITIIAVIAVTTLMTMIALYVNLTLHQRSVYFSVHRMSVNTTALYEGTSNELHDIPELTH